MTGLHFIRALISLIWHVLPKVGFQQEKLFIAPRQIVTQRQEVFHLSVSRQFLNVASLLFTWEFWSKKADNPGLVGKVILGPLSMFVSDLVVDLFNDRQDFGDIVEV